jgi:aspartate ammonia-lyase
VTGPHRIERDLLGEMEIPQGALHGIHSQRAIENFPLSGLPVHPELVHAYGLVKLACAKTNRMLGAWADDPAKADAIECACREMAAGLLDAHLVVDRLQGGAGTSTHMNVNEVIANRALEVLGEPFGQYRRVSPTDDVNLHQSTNDTYPTALRLAAIRLLAQLEREITGLSRDRWRIYKCEERLRVVNLGGTAVGTGRAAPRDYVFRVVETLRDETGVGLARAENLVEATQNADVFVEVSGMLKACAASLLKICGDLRLLSSGPEAGLGEIRLPERQAGSSIMPGKVNPVIPEAVSQAAMRVISNDVAITMACASGSLELNPFLPLVAAALLESIELLARGCDILRRNCVEGIVANEARCRSQVKGGTAAATALVPALGYERASELAHRSAETGRSIRDLVLEEGIMSAEAFEELVSPEAVCRLGDPTSVRKSGD